jgi:hypothetical protein
MVDQTKKPRFFSETRQELTSRFLSILFTAILSALITFLQSIVIEPSTGVPPQEQATLAAGVGATIRSVLEFAKHSHRV